MDKLHVIPVTLENTAPEALIVNNVQLVLILPMQAHLRVHLVVDLQVQVHLVVPLLDHVINVLVILIGLQDSA